MARESLRSFGVEVEDEGGGRPQQTFSDEAEVRSVVKRCHDVLFKDEGLDPAHAYDHLLTLLVLKLFDEQQGGGRVFQRAAQASNRRPRSDLNELAESIQQEPEFRELLPAGDGQETVYGLQEETIGKLAGELSSYNLTQTYSSDGAPDIKGEIFQEMVGETFRGELGAYFTPRQIVDFMIEFVGIDTDDKILDPTCGSGGFFIGALKALEDQASETDGDAREELRTFVESNVWGCDINERMGRTARLNLLTFSGSTGNIHVGDALDIDAEGFQEGTFDRIFSNPPFAGHEDRDRILESYRVGHDEKGDIRTVSKELPFIEKIIRLLAPGGRAAIVLPEGVLNNPSEPFVETRDYILEETRILGVIGLPQEAFHHTDTGIQGVLLFLEKSGTDAGYQVYMDTAEEVGYDTLGHKIGRNDLPGILHRYTEGKAESNLVPVSQLRQEGRFDPSYHTGAGNVETEESLLPLSSLVRADPTTVSVSKDGGTARYAYVQVGSCDKEEGTIEEWRDIVVGVDKVPSRMRYDLEPGTLLIPNHRDSIKAGRNPVPVPDTFPAEVTADGDLYLMGNKVDGVQVQAREEKGAEPKSPKAVFGEEEFPWELEYAIEENALAAPEAGGEFLLPDTFKGFVTTNRFLVLRPRDDFPASKDAVLRFVHQILRLEFVRDQQIRVMTGAASPEFKEENLDDVMVPSPSGETISSFMDRMDEIITRIEKHRRRRQELEADLQEELEKLVPE